MTETELKRSLAMKTGLSQLAVTHVLDEMANATAAGLVGDMEITLPNIGKLKTQYRPARQGRNPKTGEPLAIAAKRAVVFVPAKWLKERVAL